MDSAAFRRGYLVHLVLVAEFLRSGPRPLSRWAAATLPPVCARLGREWTGTLDRDWVQRELALVRAKAGEYSGEAYERSRLIGLPAWAAVAAGMRPTPGSTRIIGRRPRLP